MQKIPEPLKILVEQIARLPGLGPKSAMRVAMTLLKWPEAETMRLGKNIYELRGNLHLCGECGALSDVDPCNICSDPMRAADMLCLVSEWDSMLTLEEGGFYKGKYFILGGLLSMNIWKWTGSWLVLKKGKSKNLCLPWAQQLRQKQQPCMFVKKCLPVFLPSKLPVWHRVSRLAQK